MLFISRHVTFWECLRRMPGCWKDMLITSFNTAIASIVHMSVYRICSSVEFRNKLSTLRYWFPCMEATIALFIHSQWVICDSAWHSNVMVEHSNIKWLLFSSVNSVPPHKHCPSCSRTTANRSDFQVSVSLLSVSLSVSYAVTYVRILSVFLRNSHIPTYSCCLKYKLSFNSEISIGEWWFHSELHYHAVHILLRWGKTQATSHTFIPVIFPLFPRISMSVNEILVVSWSLDSVKNFLRRSKFSISFNSDV